MPGVARGHGGGGLEASCYPTHPESNGRIERFHRSTREALDDQDLRNLGRARQIIWPVGRVLQHAAPTRGAEVSGARRILGG